MSTEAGDKLDLLIAFAARDCGNDDVEMFRELDTSGVTLSDSFYAGQRRLIGRYKRKPALAMFRKCFVRVAVALLALMSVGFLTVMAVPNIRKAMVGAVVEWYEDYIAVRLDPGKDGDHTGEGTSSSAGGALTRVERAMKPTYIPQQNGEEDVIRNSESGVVIDYYVGDDLILTYYQMIYDGSETLIDSDISDMYDTEINGNKAVVIKHRSEGYMIIWTDGEYYFQLHSTVFGTDELIKTASSVK